MPHDAQVGQSPTPEQDTPVSKCCSAMFAIQMLFSATNVALIAKSKNSLDVFILAVTSAVSAHLFFKTFLVNCSHHG